MGSPPRRVQPHEAPPFDFWRYFEELPEDEWEGHDFSRGMVSYAYVMPGGRWEHVLVESDDKNVNLVLVLDLSAGEVLGHFMLDLNRVYGLDK